MYIYIYTHICIYIYRHDISTFEYARIHIYTYVFTHIAHAAIGWLRLVGSIK